MYYRINNFKQLLLEDIMKIVKLLEQSGLLIKAITETMDFFL